MARRTVKALNPDLVQPGTIAARLSSAHPDDDTEGVRTDEDIKADRPDTPEKLAQKREAFLALARRRFRMSADAESELREDMLKDLRFYNSDQWPESTKASRTLDSRVMLTINRLPQFVRQVVNQARQSRPSIQVNPVDNGADPDTAEVFQGICRHIERQSKAHVAYSTASEHQAIMGRGWWRILAEYATDDSMEQEIRIKRIADPFTVYPDPACAEPDNSDATFTILTERLNLTVYNSKYGVEGKEPITATYFSSIGDDAPTWCNSDGVLVAEYFYIEPTKYTLCDVLFTSTEIDPETGEAREPVRIRVDKKSLTAVQTTPGPDGIAPVMVLKERPAVRRQAKWALINGTEILDGNEDKTGGRDIPGSYIPVIPAIGEELIVNGKRNLRGMVRDAISPQRAYNFWISSITEKIALSTKAPVIAAHGQLEGFEEKWRQSNHRNYPYLEYNAIDVNGSLVPAPQRASYDPDIGAALQMTMQADRDLKSVIGMFDASQEKSQEQSGKAIIARQRQGEEGTSHFLDNLSRSIEHTGRILCQWIPIYYDAPRMLRINGIDDQPIEVLVHAGQGEAAKKMAETPLGQNIKSGRPFDLSVGRYDVSISVGPSYQSRRQETVEAIIQLVQAYPSLLPVVADVLMENMDWPGAKQLVPRLRRMVPPEAKDPEDGQKEIPPEVQQQLSQLQQQLEMAMSALAEKDEIIRTKAQELASRGQIARMEIQAKERMAELKGQNDLLLAQAELKADKAVALLKAQLDEIKLRLEHAHDAEQQALDRENDIEVARMTPPPTVAPRPSGGFQGPPG